ncbi:MULTISPECIES: hypothetical protein [unclassified Streptomyces]|uniref:hypothetical protein n=1 Tax=unclassified Streptomyces TaxID=2593676 RepID=UPI0029BC9AEA|nr:hypothetical protein [Streptomyces sp. DK15]MDX2389366.1 hypothetical protein [Streptomyces sp. DK15]
MVEPHDDEAGRPSAAIWAGPDDDPRQRGTLRGYLADHPMTLRMKCEGLDAEHVG